MSDAPQGPGWWQASDGKWYAPELHPDHTQAMGQPAAGQTPPQATPPGAPSPAGPPPGAFGAPPTPGGPPPAGGPTGFAGGPPTGMPPTMGGTPPGGEPPKKGNGGKIALIVGGVILVLLLIGGAVLAFSGGDDDDDDTAASTTSTTEEEEDDDDLPVERTLVPPDDDDDDVDDTTTTSTTEPDIDIDTDLGGLGLDATDLDPAVTECIGMAVMDDPALMEALENDVSDPTAPEFRVLFEVLTDCGARGYLEDSFLAELPSTQASCVSDVFVDMSDDEFIDMILGLAANDMTAAGPIMECMS